MCRYVNGGRFSVHEGSEGGGGDWESGRGGERGSALIYAYETGLFERCWVIAGGRGTISYFLVC